MGLYPERRSTRYEYDSQVAWEAAALRISDVIVFWVPRHLDSMPAFTTNVEFGMWVASNRVLCGGPPAAPKNRYLHATAERHGLPWYDDLTELMSDAATVAAGTSIRRDAAQLAVPAPVARTDAHQGRVGRLHRGGHHLEDVGHVTVMAAAPGSAPPVWVAHPRIRVAGEGRVKGNEVVVFRPDTVAVVAHGPLAGNGEAEVACVEEFRSANGVIYELPGGSVDGADPADAAATELVEETGLDVAVERFQLVRSAAVHPTLVAQRCTVFRVQLTEGELDAVRAGGRVGELVDDGEVTYPLVLPSGALAARGNVDWPTIGQVTAALTAALTVAGR